MTSLKSSPISAITQLGRAIIESPRRKIVVLGLMAVSTVLATAFMSIETGAGRWATRLPVVASRNDCSSAVLNRAPTGLSGPPRVGTKDDSGVLRLKLLLV